MPSHIWTQEELSSDLQSIERIAWRVVEAQHKVSTIKITDTLEEQDILEKLIERSKPNIPAQCSNLHYLFSAPFRYKPYPTGSRFRKSGNTSGVYYCSEGSSVAIAELAFYRVLFFAESPATPWPTNPSEFTAFAADLKSTKMLDLTSSRFLADRPALDDPSVYALTQDIEEKFRQGGGEIIQYRSVRDPHAGLNFAVLHCSVFSKISPSSYESWKIHLSASGVRAIREFPPKSIQFEADQFSGDPRMAGMNWAR